MFGLITLFSALSLAGTAAWFAIVGIMTLFAGNPVPALIMGAVIELGKIVGVSWVYRNWEEPTKLKYVALIPIVVVMLLTSMGIFGFLSKAHIEQNADLGDNTLKIERLDQRIAREQAKIDDADIIIGQLDETVNTLIEFNRISHPVTGARAVRANQQEQRDALTDTITEAQNKLDAYEDTKLELNQQIRELELEVGPVRYIAELIYEDPENSVEDAVRLVIIAFIFVFDPMAIILLMAANYTLMSQQHLISRAPSKKEKHKLIPNASVSFAPGTKPDTITKPVKDTPTKSDGDPIKPHGNGIFSPHFFKNKK